MDSLEAVQGKIPYRGGVREEKDGPENDEGHEPHPVRAPRFWKESGSVDGDHHARSLDDGVSLVTNLQAEVLGGIRRDRRNDFLAGRYLSALDVPAPERYLTGNDGNIIYRYRSEGRRCELELNAEALPVRWSMNGRWTLNIAYGDDALPYKLDGRTDGEEPLRMVLLVKERRSASTLPAGNMKLNVPQDVAVYSLDQ